MPLAFQHFADPVFHIHSIVAFGAFFGLEIGREDQRVPHPGLQNYRLGLCPRNLLRQYKLTACVLQLGLIQEENDLYGKIHLAIQILMQGIETALAVSENQHRRFFLATSVALL